MRTIEAEVRLTLKNILLLTDFSEPSELAVPFATAIAHEYESKLYAVHVLTPVPLAYASPESAAAAVEGLEEGAQAGTQRLDAQLVGVPPQIVEREGKWCAPGRFELLTLCLEVSCPL
jgi:nucleotide-binding universal stress UspA family protein